MCLHDDFYFKILCFCSKEELNSKEIKAISDYNTYNNKWDYNLTPGGQDGTVTHTTAVEQWEVEISRTLGQGGQATIRWIRCKNIFKSEVDASIEICGQDRHQGISKALFDSDGKTKVHKDPNIQWAGYGWRKVDPNNIIETDNE